MYVPKSQRQPTRGKIPLESVQDQLLSEAESLQKLIEERTQLFPILDSGLNIANLLGQWQKEEEASKAMKWLLKTLDSAIVKHDWGYAERNANSLSYLIRSS